MAFTFKQWRITYILIGLASFIIGFVLVIQFQAQRATAALEDLSEQDLGQIVKELSGETADLQTDIASYKIRLMRYQQEASNQKLILNQAVQNLEELKVSAGWTKVTGPGIKIMITDSRGALNGYDFVDLVSELRSSGAEAIAVNERRVEALSYFLDKKGQIFLDGFELASPYMILATGDSRTLYQSMVIRGGIIENFRSLEGVDVDLTEEAELILPPSTKKRSFKYAKPTE